MKRLWTNGSNPKVVVCNQTDGHENASTEHTWDELNALIKEKTAACWQFNFLGTGIDAYDTGARMGVAAMSTMSSGRSPQHVRASYAAIGESTAAYAAGRARDTHLSMGARAASGDAHFQRVFGQQGSEVPKPQSPPIPSQPKYKAVDDFSL